MGTPLRTASLFVSNKILSPLSPKVLSPVFKNSASSIVVRRNNARCHAAKRLEFSHKTLHPDSYLLNKYESVQNAVQIEVTNYEDDKNDIGNECSSIFVVNTPNKTELLSNGVTKTNMGNILGRGSFGTVMKANYRDEILAMKIVQNEEKCLLRESNGLKVNHENVIRTVDVIVNKNSNFMLVLMEYFPNSRRLQDVIDDSGYPLDNQTVIKFAKDVCKGLLHCHTSGILHLDIKPKNVLVCDNLCKICDFGNSIKILDVTSKFEHQGTVIYTDPEILRGKLPTEKSDVYSLGILLWQLKHRKMPYCDIDNIETIIYKVTKYNLRPDDTIDACDEFSKLYQLCWDQDPLQRPEISTILGNIRTM